uniref:Uncharacterized protein n=1 Tax=Ascaris lumbricoides TaxID=6252 RepID=A0A9J2PZZ0_ASCLU
MVLRKNPISRTLALTVRLLSRYQHQRSFEESKKLIQQTRGNIQKVRRHSYEILVEMSGIRWIHKTSGRNTYGVINSDIPLT